MLRKHLIRLTTVAVAALAILAAGTTQAQADITGITYGDYGFGTTSVDCYRSLHKAQFTVRVDGQYGIGYDQMMGFKIDTYRWINGAWAYLSSSAWTIGLNVTMTWWGGVSQPGYYLHRVTYAWWTASGWATGSEWVKRYTVWTNGLASWPGYCQV